MKVILEFDDVPEGILEGIKALKANAFLNCISEIKQFLRQKIKYSDLKPTELATYDEIYEEVNTIINDSSAQEFL